MEPAEKVDASAAETKVEAHEAADNEHERRAAKALAEGSFDDPKKPAYKLYLVLQPATQLVRAALHPCAKPAPVL